MADIRKGQERDELHRAIWAIADELRGSVDGWDFKSYVLGMMFYRYISENLTNYINEGEIEAGNDGFDYALLSDEDAGQAREDLVKTKGFFILPSELFCNVKKKAASDENLNMTLETAFHHIEESAKGSESEDNFAGLFDDIDVNSNKLGATVAKRNANLVKLIEGVANMGLGDYKDNSIDAFGDAYEYLMSMYASNAGKSGGEFFTPQEVSELLTRMAVAGKTEVNKVYDPACGSGSLLLKAAKILGKENVRQGFYGQEINLTTYNLCRINMFLHDIDFDKFDIAHEDTLLSPQHWDDEPFEVIVSNPPYSIKWEGDENPVLINDPRFSPAGVLAPKSKADLAFIMHSLSWLAANGTAAIVCFPGIMYRGGAEKKIRQYLIDNNFIDCIIQLPSNLFFGTSIATCIMVLRRSKVDNKTLFIDASSEFVKITNNNRLTEENIVRIVNEFVSRADVDHFARCVPYEEIASQDYNLSVSTYVEAKDTREKIDIVKLNAEIEEIVAREQVLRDEIAKIIAEIEQYAYYRDKLLEHGDNAQSCTLKDVCLSIADGDHMPPPKSDSGIPFITISNITENKQIDFSSVMHVPRTYYENLADKRKAKSGDILYTVVGSFGTPVHIIDDTEFVFQRHIAILRPNQSKVIPRYMYHAMQSTDFYKQADKAAKGAAQRTIGLTSLGNMTIPVPPLNVQEHLVHVLDNFDAICSDLKTGLPAEIEARQKQYEYYRDKLLTFKTAE